MLTYTEWNARRQELDYQQVLLDLQRKYPNTPPGKAVALDCAEAELSRREEELASEWENIRDFRSSYDIPIAPCIGRENALESIHRHFADGCSVVIVTGIGGIGKSLLAREYASRFASAYDAVLVLPCMPSLRQKFRDDVYLHSSEPPYSSKIYSSRRQYGRKKFEALQRMLERRNCLVILDDVNGMEPILAELFAMRGDFLVTTRKRAAELMGTEQNGVDTVPWAELRLSGLSAEYCEAFYRALCEEDPDKNEFERFRAFSAATLFHPLSMELWMKTRSREAALLSDAHQKPLHAQITAFQTGLFRRLDASEQKILLWLSLLPEAGVGRTWFCRMSGTSEAMLNRLTARFLVRTYTGSAPPDADDSPSRILLHPVIRQSVLRNSDLSIRKNRVFLVCLARDLENAWNEPKEANRQKEEAVLQVLKQFPPTAAWMAETFDSLITFLWIEEYYTEAERYALQLYDSVQKYYGQFHQISAFAALRTAAVYFNSRRFSEARSWYERALTCLDHCEPFNSKYNRLRVTALYKIAREHQNSGESKKAWECLSEAIRVAEICGAGEDKRYWNLELTYLYRRAAVLHLTEDRAAADMYLEKMHEAARFVATEEQGNPIYAADIGETDALFLQASGRYEEAAMILEKNLMIYKRFRGESHEDTLHARELLADAQELCGRSMEAGNLRRETLLVLQRHYPREKEWIRTLATKLP